MTRIFAASLHVSVSSIFLAICLKLSTDTHCLNRNRDKTFGTMNIAIKLTRTPASSCIFSSSSSQQFGRNLKAPGGLKFQHSQAKPDKMEEANKSKPQPEQGDAGMTESFGDGYSTRSNEEGFGGIYGGNEEEGGEEVHGISPEQKEYEKSQGSHVEEKENARNQK